MGEYFALRNAAACVLPAIYHHPSFCLGKRNCDFAIYQLLENYGFALSFTKYSQMSSAASRRCSYKVTFCGALCNLLV